MEQFSRVNQYIVFHDILLRTAYDIISLKTFLKFGLTKWEDGSGEDIIHKISIKYPSRES
jgi:hypothetical protein